MSILLVLNLARLLWNLLLVLVLGIAGTSRLSCDRLATADSKARTHGRLPPPRCAQAKNPARQRWGLAGHGSKLRRGPRPPAAHPPRGARPGLHAQHHVAALDLLLTGGSSIERLELRLGRPFGSAGGCLSSERPADRSVTRGSDRPGGLISADVDWRGVPPAPLGEPACGRHRGAWPPFWWCVRAPRSRGSIDRQTQIPRHGCGASIPPHRAHHQIVAGSPGTYAHQRDRALGATATTPARRTCCRPASSLSPSSRSSWHSYTMASPSICRRFHVSYDVIAWGETQAHLKDVIQDFK